MDIAIAIEGLCKQYQRYNAHRPRKLKDLFTHGFRGLKPMESFWALDNINLTIERGKMVGIIGANGSGKSTLLRLISGIGRPNTGQITTQGQIRALLDLGTNFQPDLTGRENAFLTGVVAGLTRQEVSRRFDDIVSFAELEDFIDSPLRTYSTGMQMRMAFSIAIHTDPDILLIDEVLAVGDLAFQQKCVERIYQFKDQGCTIILVSHETASIEQFCDEAIWLDKGRVAAQGNPQEVLSLYRFAMLPEKQLHPPGSHPVKKTSTGTELVMNKNRFGTLEMEIVDVCLFDVMGNPLTELIGGYPVTVEIRYQAPKPIRTPIFSITICREDGLICYDINTQSVGLTTSTAHGTGKIQLQLERLDLNNGLYYVDVGVYEKNWAHTYDYHWHAYPLQMRSSAVETGVLYIPHRWKLPKSNHINGQMESHDLSR